MEENSKKIDTYLKKITGKKPDDYYTKIIPLEDLRPGDILAFSGEGEESLITKLILCFTNSWVSHGALFYQHGPVEALTDAGSTGIQGHKVTSNPEDRVAYVSRLIKTSKIGNKSSFYSDKEMAPVLAAAKGYVEQNLPYPYADLVFLSLILLYKDHSQARIKQSIIIALLRCLAAELKKLLDDKYRHNYTMVCSSLVYQCYLDASKKNRKFKLKLTKDADLSCRTSKKGLLNQNRRKANTLLDLYAEHAAEYDFKTEAFHQAVAPKEPVANLEDLAKEIVESDRSNRVMMLKGNALSSAIENLLKTLMEVLGFTFTSIKDMIKNAREMQAMFVTPNDLCFNIENVKKIGKVHLNRADENLPHEQLTDFSKT
ncbi:MAG: hypothetical protein MJZ10_07075 [Fibrobacter sp.]|nr:hypothetical protein [Fibrobacter sp.]